MNITDVRVRRVSSSPRMKAVASITFDGEFVVHDLKVLEGDRGLFVVMPSKRNANNEFTDVAHPINTETRNRIQNAVIEAYNNLED